MGIIQLLIAERARLCLISLLFFINIKQVYSNPNAIFHFNSNCIEAQKHISALRLSKAQEWINLERTNNPKNAAVHYLESCLDYYRLISSQDFTSIKQVEKNKDQHLKILKGVPISSPFHLYAQSEIHLQWAIIKLLREEYFGAMFDFRSAYNMAELNMKKFPTFLPSSKTVGFFRALFGSTPDNYKWILNIAGLDGNFEQGMNLMKAYLNQPNFQEMILDKQASLFYVALFELNYGDKKQSWELVKHTTDDYKQNLLSCYLRAYVGSKTAHNDEAIDCLNNRPKSSDYEPFYILDYILGITKLNRLDNDADQPLKRFTSFYKGKIFVKDAYRRISWVYLLAGNIEKYNIYKGLSIKKGSSESEEDKFIAQEAANGVVPDATLLRARLLFDGGYYTKAEDLIKFKKPEDFPTQYRQLEYYYRYGRILQEQNKLTRAVECFKQVIKIAPINTPYYFAPNACLQLGLIYKNLGFPAIAKGHFTQLKKYSKAEYIQSLTIKANKELDKL